MAGVSPGFVRAARTLGWLRVRLFLNRSFHGLAVANLAAAAALGLSMALLALGIGFGFGVFFFIATRNPDPLVFLAACHTALGYVFAAVLLAPVFYAGGQEGIDPRRLVGFPIGAGRLYALLLGSELLNSSMAFVYPTLLAVTVGIVLSGRAVAVSLGVLALFTAVTVVWGNLLLLGLQGFLRERRLREVFMVTVAFLLIGIGFLPHAIARYGPRFRSAPLLHAAKDLGGVAVSVLPSVMAARALSALRSGAGAWAQTGGLVLFLAAGLALGRAVFRRTVLEGPSGDGGKGAAAHAPPAAGVSAAESLAGRFLPPETLAVWAKDRRTILRSAVGKLNLLLAPLVTLFVATMFISKRLTPFAGYAPAEYLFLLLGFYISALGTNLFGNLFAWEGPGMKAYFTAPASGRRVLLGKDLALWSFGMLLFLEFVVVFSLCRGVPRPGVLASGVLCYGVALAAYATAGNYLSILFPKRNDIASWRMSAPSNMAVLANLFILAGVLTVLSAAVLLPSVLHAGGWTPSVLLAVLGLAALGYRWSLGPAERLMAARREELIRTLGGVD